MVLASPHDMFIVATERRVRKHFAGKDYLTAEKFYKAFFSVMSRAMPYYIYRRHNAAYYHSWYFNTYMPRMTGVIGKSFHARPGVAELFGKLREKGVPFAIYSDYPLVAERLAAIGLGSFVCPEKTSPAEGGPDYPLLFGLHDFGAAKPSPRPLLEIAASLGAAPERVTVIGDRDDADGEGARTCGMRYFKASCDAEWIKAARQIENEIDSAS
jgi:FMN phosphatase YigB (HAD superfamily)